MDDITGISSLVGNVLNLEVDDPIQKLKNELEAEKEKTITANDQIRVLTSDVEHTAQKANEKVSELEAQLRDREHTPSEELAQMRHAMLEMARGKEAAEEANRDLDVKLTEVEWELKGANAKALVVGGDIEAAAAAQSYVCMGVFPLAGDNSLNGLWPDGQVVTYRFLDGHPNQRMKVTKAIPEWSRYANITFKLVSDDAHFAISFENKWECWSHIGADLLATSALATASAPCTMALGPVSISANMTRGDRALILHQFGHALGLVHEHMSPSETDVNSLKLDRILEHPSFVNAGPVIEEYLDGYSGSSITNYTSPDLSSIMIFSMPGSLNEGNITIEPNFELSPLDKAFMVINYPRVRVHSQASEWTLRHALLVANVDESTSRLIIQEQDLTKRRTLFSDFLSTVRKTASTDAIDPIPRIVNNLGLPAVRDALHALFADPAEHPKAKDILEDENLKEKLITVLDRLASHPVIHEVIQRGKAVHLGPPPRTSDPRRSGHIFVNSLLHVALMLHGAVGHRDSALNNDTDNAVSKQVDAATAFFMQLAQHTTFRVAIERAVGEEVSSMEAAPDVSALVARLAERPAVLQAVRQALLGPAPYP